MILAGKATKLAEEVGGWTAGAIVRAVEQAAKEEVRCFVESVLQEIIRLNLEEALGRGAAPPRSR